MKRKQIITGLIFLGIIAITSYSVRIIIKHIRIDKCLDCGGSWNYELNKCEDYILTNSVDNTDLYWHSSYDSVLNKEYLKKGEML